MTDPPLPERVGDYATAGGLPVLDGAETVRVHGKHALPAQTTRPPGPGKTNQPLLAFTFCIISLAIGLLSLKMSSAAKIGPYGLIQALSPLYYCAIAMLVASFAWSLRPERNRSVLLGAHLAALVFLVHGAPSVVEGTARFQTAWLHTGLANYIASTGGTLPLLDARFSWPSFFSGVAMLDRVAGVSSAEVFLLWWPVALNLLYLPLIFRIAKEFLRSETKAWVAAALFPLANWVGQDYFSPQSVAFLLYLAFIFILVGPLGANEQPAWRSLARRRHERPGLQPGAGPGDGVPPGHLSPRVVAFYLGVLVLLMAAMATGHQLTPVMAVATALALVIAGRTRIRGMVVVFAVMAVGWICYGAATFWSGHMGMMVGGLGNLQGNLGTSVVQRVTGSATHEHVVDVRVLAAALVWGIAVLGALAWRQGGADRRAVVLAFIAAFGMIAGGDYGGEGVLRVYLFSLPAAVCLMAVLITGLPRFWPGQLALGCTLLLLTPLFLVARWGNELYEMTRPNELTAVNELYKIASPGSSLINIVPMIAWEYRDISEFNYMTVNLDGLGPQTLSRITAAAASNPRGGYVIMTAGQEAYGWQAYGMPKNWGATIEELLSHSENFRLRYANSDAEIFQYIPTTRTTK